MVQNENGELFEIGSRVIWLNRCHNDLPKSKISHGEIVDEIVDCLAPVLKDDGKFLIKHVDELTLENTYGNAKIYNI